MDGCQWPVHRVVARWAHDTPDAPAISCADGKLSYRELDERANRLAHHLRSLGVAREVVVAIHLDRGLDHYVALLAVLKAGGAALPLDPTYPAERLRYMVNDSAARVLLTRWAPPELSSPDGTRTVVRLDADAARIAASPPTPLSDEAALADLAYVLYTSASTGAPKGVLLEHGGIANLCRWHVAALGLTSADCGSLAAPLSFDAAMLDLWPVLAVGGRTVAIADEDRADLSGLVRALRDNRVTVCFLTTALAEIFLAQPGLEDLRLRYLVTGGEVLRRRPRPGLPFRLINIYGPTETTVYVTSTIVDDTATGDGAIPIGRPIGGVDVRLLDGQDRPVPDGEPGEIVVAGPGVGRGYLGRPDLTTTRFRPAPGGPPGIRCYHTGDLARRRADGCLEFLGRLDRQVKVRGHRIEPEEVERVLLRHAAVRQAAVAAVRPTPDTMQLVAYIEAAPDRLPAPEPEVRVATPDRTDGDPGTVAVVRDLAPGSLLEMGAGVAGLDRACHALARVESTEDSAAARGEFDTVLIDCFSVRYPSADRLLADLTRAVELTVDGGAVVLAGVPSLPLLAAAHCAAEITDAPDGMTTNELSWRVRGRLLADTELAVHPALFTALTLRSSRIAAVEVAPRYERLDAPRYDVVLRIGAPVPLAEPTWLDWTGDGLDAGRIRDRLRAGEQSIVAVRGIPNGDVLPHVVAWERAGTVADVGELRQAMSFDGPTPIDLLALAAGVPYRAQLSWSAGRPDGSMDAVWFRHSGAGHLPIRWPGPDSEPAEFANRPWRLARDAALRAELRKMLVDRFVAHEMPDMLAVLDRLPLSPVGKVDRDALPLPHWLTGGTSRVDGSWTPVEAAVVRLLGEVFGHTRVGRTDNLVALGAHSLTLAQLAVRITARFGVEMPVRELFANPTVAAIAARVADSGPRRPAEVA
jgi:pristinamycin I synthase-3/4